MDNILELHNGLINKTYRHGGYQSFKVTDPKIRDIHKASVRDRLLHHAIYRILYLYFDRKFIYDSYSCRIGKGTHRAMNRFRRFGWVVSKNNTRTAWVLKCDIRKFFSNIDHKILLEILSKHIGDSDVLWLLEQIIGSFNTSGKIGVGLPLGNLTSQLLINIYMNEFDHFIKRKSKERYYIRYADDFVILSESNLCLDGLLPKIDGFLENNLRLELHPDKVFIKPLASGIDFLGWVHFFDHRILRKSTKKRLLKRILENTTNKTYQSYFGLLEHGNAVKIRKALNQLYYRI
ncbi:MAG: RNA-directed polymerase [Candidatus Berkelbacteria bacterium]|nr:RNA-directed polymerase [Candidatus Berkelbacteria bacterium]